MNIQINHLDLGGGYGITYNDETPPSQSKLKEEGLDLPISIEPGRSIAGNAGILVTEVEYLKENSEKNFAIIDAAMNDLLRPSLYSAYHNIVTVNKPEASTKEAVYDVVGPVCETGDILGKDRHMAVKEGDLLAILSAGAYGFTMSSNYNTRPRAVEVLVNDDKWQVVRKRETVSELFENESIAKW